LRTDNVGLDIPFNDVVRKIISVTNQVAQYTSNDIIVSPETETRRVSVILAKEN